MTSVLRIRRSTESKHYWLCNVSRRSFNILSLKKSKIVPSNFWKKWLNSNGLTLPLPALGFNLRFLLLFPFKVDPLNLESQTKYIPVVLSSSPIPIRGKSVKGFLSYDWTSKQTEITTLVKLWSKVTAFWDPKFENIMYNVIPSIHLLIKILVIQDILTVEVDTPKA